MIKYNSDRQLTIEEFKTPFQTSLLADNRWVKLSKVVPWDKFASVYMSMMTVDFGRPGISPRIVLGALIIKHLEKLDDRGVIAAIQENPYMQFFIGLKEFTVQSVFDPSLFAEIRKRAGNKVFDSLNVELIKSVSEKEDKKHNRKGTDKTNNTPKNKGKMQADATVADQYITYPTDNGILNQSRKQCEKLIDKLYDLSGKEGEKPRTYRRKIDKAYLDYSKKKKKREATHRKMTRKLLECVNRDIKHVNNMLDIFESKGSFSPLKHSEQRMLWIINTAYAQQKFMYNTKTHSCTDRIVSIFQPHVRPIPRGKTKAQIEFGSKLGVSLDKGFARINAFSWDAYHEGGDLIKQVESYRELHGHYPELVQVDKIYATRENRMWLTERNVRITAVPLGRRKGRETETYYQKQKRRKEAAERNHIEGKFGQGKNGYNLNEIRARLKNTSESWVACIFFIMNLILYEKGYIFDSILGEINSTKNKIIERGQQIMMLFIPKQVCLCRKLKVDYLL
ncbi:MAG: IS5 family transposase, partial [Bacteroidales bacterium]|nr:IS5 family transposase [Bacteroidales bacterium]